MHADRLLLACCLQAAAWTQAESACLMHMQHAKVLPCFQPRPLSFPTKLLFLVMRACAVCLKSEIGSLTNGAWAATCVNSNPGGQCTGTCDLGYDGTPVISCQSDGTWTTIVGSCNLLPVLPSAHWGTKGGAASGRACLVAWQACCTHKGSHLRARTMARAGCLACLPDLLERRAGGRAHHPVARAAC